MDNISPPPTLTAEEIAAKAVKDAAKRASSSAGGKKAAVNRAARLAMIERGETPGKTDYQYEARLSSRASKKYGCVRI